MTIFKNQIFHLFTKESFIVLIGLFSFFMLAFFGEGFYHADEHYQIIEFAGYPLGTHRVSDLAWEFNYQIRSGFQPMIAFVSFRILSFIGINNPYSQLFFLRILSALLAFLAIRHFLKYTKDSISQQYRLIYTYVSYLLWIIPFVFVRFSSESWAGIFMLWAVGFSLNKATNPTNYLAIGIFMGIAFLCRYQSAFMSLGLLFWFGFIQRERVKNLLYLLGGGFIMLIFGGMIDAWFYKVWTLSWWNYFEMGILKEGGAGFGTSPWWFYLKDLLLLPTYPLGLLIGLSVLLFVFRKYRHPVFWVVIPFFVIHCMIPHKESRFVFPLVIFIPFILISLVEVFDLKWFKYILTPFLMFNLIVLFANYTLPMGNGMAKISHRIAKEPQEIILVNTAWASPYNPWGSLEMKFYSNTKVKQIEINNLCGFSDTLINVDRKTWIVCRAIDLDNQLCRDSLYKNFEVRELTQGQPQWLISLNSYYTQKDTESILHLLEVSQKKK